MRELIEADWLQRGGDFSLAQTKAVLQRGHALALRLRRKADATRLEALTAKLIQLEARRLVRDLAFRNPLLLEVPGILFITRQATLFPGAGRRLFTTTVAIQSHGRNRSECWA